MQAVVVMALIIFTGLALGRIRVAGISLGVTFVFFMGIFAGYLGFTIDDQMLNYAESFGLVLFVYALGLQVGPGFFSSFRKGGIRMNGVSLILIVAGSALAVGIGMLCHYGIDDMTGVLCGATTNTPALAAAQQTLKQLGLPTDSAALGCAVTYPLGVVGVIFAMIFLKKFFVRPVDLEEREADHSEQTFIATFVVKNPAVFERTLGDVRQTTTAQFIVSRIWRDRELLMPSSDSVLQEGDRLLTVTTEKNVDALTLLFGEKEDRDWNHHVNWNKLDRQLVSRHIVVSRPEINGKRFVDLRLRTKYGINITRVNRSGVDIIPYQGMELQLGDKVMVVGSEDAINKVSDLLGNSLKKLHQPHILTIFLGIAIGVLVGSIPLFSIPQPVKLGLAAGPMIMAILIGRFGTHWHLITYTTLSANLMLREVGLAMFLAAVGLASGDGFVEAVVAGGYIWMIYAVIIAVVPVILVGVFARLVYHMDFYTIMGMLSGSMTNPISLSYANGIAGNDMPAISYATVYPLVMFLRVIFAQMMILFMM